MCRGGHEHIGCVPKDIECIYGFGRKGCRGHDELLKTCDGEKYPLLAELQKILTKDDDYSSFNVLF